MRTKNKKQGFSLVEALVAISIFTLAVVTIMVTLSRGISNTNYSKQKMTAEYLAAEGVEYIRNLRDTYVIYASGGAQAGWNTFVGQMGPCIPVNGCYFSDLSSGDYGDQSMPITNLTFIACGTPCQELRYNSATGKYNYSSGTPSGFRRQIRMEAVPGNPDERKISVTVSWPQKSGSSSLTFSENLYNWVE